MPSPIEDYALIGDCQTAALVANNGSIDWLCWPRFDSDSCFAALLGNEDHGRWRIAPRRGSDHAEARVRRAYRANTLVLETVFETPDGSVALIDFMPPRPDGASHPISHLVRLVVGRAGRVAMRSEMALRFDYGATTPWVTQLPDGSGVRAVAGPSMAVLRASGVELRGEGMQTVADFEVGAGDTIAFVLSHAPSHLPVPAVIDPLAALAETEKFWSDWSSRCTGAGEWTEAVRRSLLTLKALTYAPTGGIVAAPTTSLPEKIGGVRNWDYRYCWLRDAALTLFALMNAGYFDEAQAWRMWLERAVAGNPENIRIMYGIAGERRLAEWEVDWLPGYENSRPVRVGNAASDQVQLDVYGQLMGAIHYARIGGLVEDETIWPFQKKLLEHLETIWQQPDYSIWEVRDKPAHFTFSKVMVWTAFDTAIKSAEHSGLDGPIEHWRALRDQIHAEVCERGFDPRRNAFVQSYGSKALDASLLLMPLTGFLPHDDPRVIGTVAAIERDLVVDGLVRRYHTTHANDGLPPGEGVFLACSFWLVDNFRLQGRRGEARALFTRLLALANDVGLLAEEYDPVAKRLVGNFPQAFSHVALVNAALGLSREADIGKDVKAGAMQPEAERERESAFVF